jgi:hypothetical protein
LKFRDPFPLPSTSWAVRLSPSASWSFPRTPGAATDRVTPVVAVYESFAATGAAFVTVIVTVAEPSNCPESLYLNVSVPTKPEAGM